MRCGKGNGRHMDFIRFLFVLAIVIPLAVLMIYLINNLNGSVKASENETKAEVKTRRAGASDERTVKGRTATTGTAGDRQAGNHDGETERERRKRSLHEERRERIRRERRETEKEVSEKKEKKKPVRQPSKRKRRKERRNRRKAGEDRK